MAGWRLIGDVPVICVAEPPPLHLDALVGQHAVDLTHGFQGRQTAFLSSWGDPPESGASSRSRPPLPPKCKRGQQYGSSNNWPDKQMKRRSHPKRLPNGVKGKSHRVAGSAGRISESSWNICIGSTPVGNPPATDFMRARCTTTRSSAGMTKTYCPPLPAAK